MKNNQCLISILIPTYNNERTIASTIDNLLNQSCDKKKYQIIVINDGSTDKTLDILRSYKSSNLKIYSQKNHGVSYTWRRLLSLTKTPFLCWCDADDYYLKDAINLFLDQILNDKTIDLIIGKCMMGFPNFKFAHSYFTTNRMNVNNNLLKYYSKNCPYLFGKLYKTDLFKKYVIFKDKMPFTADIMATSLYFQKVKKFKMLNKFIYWKSVDKFSVMHTSKCKKINIGSIYAFSEFMKINSNLEYALEFAWKIIICFATHWKPMRSNEQRECIISFAKVILDNNISLNTKPKDFLWRFIISIVPTYRKIIRKIHHYIQELKS